MKRYQRAWILIAVIMALGVGQNLYYWTQLPETVAIHFRADGAPNQWASKSASTVLMICLQVGLPLFLILVTSAVRFLPVQMVNIPQREYWLAPERKESSLEYIQTSMAWISLATAIYILVISHVVFLANSSGNALNNWAFGSTLVAYLVVEIFLASRIYCRFRKPPDTVD